MGDLTNYYILCIEDPSYLRSLIAITLLLDSCDAICSTIQPERSIFFQHNLRRFLFLFPSILPIIELSAVFRACRLPLFSLPPFPFSLLSLLVSVCKDQCAKKCHLTSISLIWHLFDAASQTDQNIMHSLEFCPYLS
jgi:hypothetical protein